MQGSNEDSIKSPLLSREQLSKKPTPSMLIAQAASVHMAEDNEQKSRIIKLMNLQDYSIYHETSIPVSEPLFEAIPPIIRFDDYQPSSIQEKLLRLRNKDKVVRYVRIAHPESSLIQVESISKSKVIPVATPLVEGSQLKNVAGMGAKIAPGMEARFCIRFSPDIRNDFTLDLKVITDREEFIVPIKATGERALLEFPDSIDFGDCPVKYETEKSVMLRNSGACSAKWTLTLPPGFDADRKEGVLDGGCFETIIIKFFPLESRIYKAEVRLSYSKMDAYVTIMGKAISNKLHLSKGLIVLEDTFIGLRNQQTFQIINKSNFRANFEWRTLISPQEEREKKQELLNALDNEEAEERAQLWEKIGLQDEGDTPNMIDRDENDSEQEQQDNVLQQRYKKAKLALERKYRNIRVAIEEDPLLFKDPIFSIDPEQGQVWPNSALTVTVNFSPQAAVHYNATAFCNIACCEERLSINLSGDGIGPKAVLSQSELPVGNKFVNQSINYDIFLENRGEIECKWQLLPNERTFGKMFVFKRIKGTLNVGQRALIPITFCGKMPGEFKEQFKFQLEGNTETLSLLCYGHIIAPTFHFDCDVIDFKKISYSFPDERIITLFNESDVEFNYSLRVPSDGKLIEREFTISPDTGSIQPKESKKISVQFVPRATKNYETVLVVDIENVGFDMFSLPIKAQSEIPNVSIEPLDLLEFGNVFLRFPSSAIIKLKNDSPLKAKFEILPQNEDSKVLATHHADQESGIIEPWQSVDIDVSLITRKLGEITLPIAIEIIGQNQGQPYIIHLNATSIGPIVEIGNKIKELDFGTVEVLKDYIQRITIKNLSKIEADFHAFTKNPDSVFHPQPRHAILLPDQSLDVEIRCNADDAVKFIDTLYFIIKEGTDIEVVLKAKGEGHTIYCSEDLNRLKFETQYTSRTITKDIFIENRGRQPQRLQWVRKKQSRNQEQRDKPMQSGQKAVEGSNIFSIYPDTLIIPAKHGVTFQVTGNSINKGHQMEQFVLNSQVGNERKTNTLFITQIEGDFYLPTLSFSQRKIIFKYCWEKDVPIENIQETLTVTCSSPLPVKCLLKVAAPFSINQDTLELNPGETVDVIIEFDPSQKHDRLSGQVVSKLQVVNYDHPHKDVVDLIGEVVFPNIQFSATIVDFGAILSETSKKIGIQMENVSLIGLDYEWAFVEEELPLNITGSERSSIIDESTDKEPDYPSIPINEVFDILPLSGHLDAGEKEYVEFTHNAFRCLPFQAVAVCKVYGGPCYEVKLFADSSLLTYKLSTNTIEIGEVQFCDMIQQSMYIENVCKVPFEYKISLQNTKRKEFLAIFPMEGRINGGDKQKLTIRFAAVMPADLKEVFHIQVGYFEPEQVTISGHGSYPSILCNLPRTENEWFQQAFTEILEKRRQEREIDQRRRQLLERANGVNTSMPEIKSMDLIIKEIERDLDRQWFCQMIQQTIDTMESSQLDIRADRSSRILVPMDNTSSMQASKLNVGSERKLYENIVLATYVCDFGTIIINSVRKKTFRIQNMSQAPLEFSLDCRAAKAQGYQLTPEKVIKLPPGEQTTITIVYQANKSEKFGHLVTEVPIDVKHGARYMLQLIANVTIPEIQLEDINDNVDFGKVLCGQRMTYYIRLCNMKEIGCQWSQGIRHEVVHNKSKESTKFTMMPTSGFILPGKKQLVEIQFQPTLEKSYSQKLYINIKDNPKQFAFTVKGDGVAIDLTFSSKFLQCGPALPYASFCYQVLDIKNPTDYDTELMALNYDEQFEKDEEILQKFLTLEKKAPVFSDVLKPGEGVWPAAFEAVNRDLRIKQIQTILEAENQRIANENAQKSQDEQNTIAGQVSAGDAPASMKDSGDFARPAQPQLVRQQPAQEAKLKASDQQVKKDAGKQTQKDVTHEEAPIESKTLLPLTEDEKKNLEKELLELTQEISTPNYPEKVEDNVMMHVLLLGPPGCYKTNLLKHLSVLHKREYTTIDGLIDSCLATDSEISSQLKSYLETRSKQREIIESQRDKLIKKAGKKGEALVQEWGPIDEAQFFYLSEELIIQALKMTLSNPRFNAGFLCDGLQSRYCHSKLFALKCLMSAVENHGLMLAVMDRQYDTEGLETIPPIQWENMFQFEKEEEEDAQEVKPRRGQTKEDQHKTKGASKQAKKINIKNEKLFDVFAPLLWVNSEDEALWHAETAELKLLMGNTFDKFLEPVPPVQDPAIESEKKEEKKVEPKKPKKGVAEEVVEQPAIPDYSHLQQGPRHILEFPLQHNIPQLLTIGETMIPAPVYPDPNSLPIPEPKYQQLIQPIVRESIDRQSNTFKTTRSFFDIYTPLEDWLLPLPQPEPGEEINDEQEEQQLQEPAGSDINEQDGTEEIQRDAAEGQKEQDVPSVDKTDLSKEHSSAQEQQPIETKEQKAQEHDNEQNTQKPIPNTAIRRTDHRQKKIEIEEKPEIREDEIQPVSQEFSLDQLSNDQKRWIVPANRTLRLVCRYFATSPGTRNGCLLFANIFGARSYQVEVKGISDVPFISNVPRNLFMTVRKSRPVNSPENLISKAFIQSENIFDFGPLLVGKDSGNRNSPDMMKTNSTVFRLSNPGKFPADVAISLLSSSEDVSLGRQKGIFWIEQEQLTIEKDGIPLEVRVWAIPNADERFTDDLIVQIKDNPVPVVIPMTCQGAKPQISITEGEKLIFDRLRLNQSRTMEIKLKNEGFIPAKWTIDNLDALPAEFSVSHGTGVLKPMEETTISIKFTGGEPQKIVQQLNLQAEDCEGMGQKMISKQIQIEAEAFDVSVDLRFPDNNDNNSLDFGAVKVGEVKERSFFVKNIGIYKVKLNINLQNKLFKDNFRIETTSLELEPGQETEITVRFSCKKELKLKTNHLTTGIILDVLEGKTLELCRPIPINVVVSSMFSKYTISPPEKLNFGALYFKDNKTSHLEIRNDGLFEFEYIIYEYGNEEIRRSILLQREQEASARLQNFETPAQVDKKDKGQPAKKEVKEAKKAQVKGKSEDSSSTLKIGQWTISPSTNIVAPDSTANIQVTFAGQDHQQYDQRLVIEILGRDPDVDPAGIMYELSAESCIPGIDCDAFESIFEEQMVVPSMTTSTQVAQLIDSGLFYIEEKLFSFGTVIPASCPDGVSEKFKIINPNKIPCTVKFDVRKQSQNQNEQFAFDVATKTAKIGAREHIYVKVYFKPTIMAQYAGVFEAIVEGGEQMTKTYKLQFDLRGEGAIPTLKLEKPKEYLNERQPVLRFPKLRVNKTMILPIILKNEGLIPATAKISATVDQSFKLISQSEVTITPKTYNQFDVKFIPYEQGPKTWELQLTTVNNPYETTSIIVTGEGFQQNITFDNLPGDSEDLIELGDCIINHQQRCVFNITNSGSEVIRFNWTTSGQDEYTITPQTGHVNPKASKQLTLVFKPTSVKPKTITQLLCQTQDINHVAQGKVLDDWDSSMCVVKYVTQVEYDDVMKKRQEQAQAKRFEEAQATKGQKKVEPIPPKLTAPQHEPEVINRDPNVLVPLEEPIVEPEYKSIEKTDKILTLNVAATADYANYTIEAKEITFKSTMMYSTRIHSFWLKNPSLIHLNYSIKIVSYDGNNVARNDSGFFHVTPKTGIISPGNQEMFTVRFQPLEVDESCERFLVFNIQDLDPNVEPLIIALDGIIDRPVCHFEIPHSDYRSKKSDIDSQMQIIEMESLGMKVTNTNRFFVINATSLGYRFEWKRFDEENLPYGANASDAASFKCHTLSGTILSGKKFEMAFSYTPESIGTHESYWIFSIPEQGVTQTFLIVGTVVEPNVFFDKGKIDFGPLLINCKNRETIHLRNLEEIPITFNFAQDSIKGETEYGDSLFISPMSGTVNPQKDLQIEVVFVPKVETAFNYNLVCYAKRKSRPITLNVKGIGYQLHHRVSCEGVDLIPESHTLLSIDFGEIYVHERRSKIITIENKGEFNFAFNLKKLFSSSFIQITPESGTVKKGDCAEIEVHFAPLAEFSLGANHTIVLSITSGPSYTFRLLGQAKRPGVEFSFLNYNFGPQFVTKQPLSISQTLFIRNRDSASMTLETTFAKTPYLSVNLPPGQVILPLQTTTTKDQRGNLIVTESNVLEVPIVFTPREAKKYCETIIFDVNNLYQMPVSISGEGIPLKIELERAEDGNIDLGIIRAGRSAARSIILINQSKLPIGLSFDVGDQFIALQKKYLSVSPAGELTVGPKERRRIDIEFAPKTRQNFFRHDLNFKLTRNQEIRKLTTISAACHGLELKLNEDSLSFGAVQIKSRKTLPLILSNIGDISANFSWDLSFCKRYFEIKPEKGYLRAHEDLVFNVTFHPDVLDNDIRFNKVRCNVEGSEPLHINLLGKCHPQPKEPTQTLKFETIVRTIQKQKIQIKNPAAEPCAGRVSISTPHVKWLNYFEGPSTIDIPGHGQSEYEISYKPLTMTVNEKNPDIKDEQHEASLFIPMPDGSALVYDLIGKSLPSMPIPTDNMIIKARTSAIKVLQLENWLHNLQRFTVTWSTTPEDPSIFLNGAQAFDVPGDREREYKLSIYGLKQTSTVIDVHFLNEQTKEFIAYRINLTIQPPDPINKIEMTAVVRETSVKYITLENPYPHPVEITREQVTMSNDVLKMSPSQLTIPPHSEAGYEISYRPLLVKEEQATITIKSPELGEFVYTFGLQGIAGAAFSRKMLFKAPLGSDVVQTFKFINYCKTQTTYQCRIDRLGGKQPTEAELKNKGNSIQQLDFYPQSNSIPVPASSSPEGNEVTLHIKYEPSSLGESQGLLVLSSTEGGEYNCVLQGASYPPQPKGPFKLTSGKGVAIDFKNPFFEAMEITIRLDNPNFTTSVKSPIKIEGKKQISIPISYKAVAGTNMNGRLSIQVEKSDLPSWVFYLAAEGN